MKQGALYISEVACVLGKYSLYYVLLSICLFLTPCAAFHGFPISENMKDNSICNFIEFQLNILIPDIHVIEIKGLPSNNMECTVFHGLPSNNIKCTVIPLIA